MLCSIVQRAVFQSRTVMAVLPATVAFSGITSDVSG